LIVLCIFIHLFMRKQKRSILKLTKITRACVRKIDRCVCCVHYGQWQIVNDRRHLWNKEVWQRVFLIYSLADRIVFFLSSFSFFLLLRHTVYIYSECVCIKIKQRIEKRKSKKKSTRNIVKWSMLTIHYE